MVFECRLLDHEHQQQNQHQTAKMYDDAADAGSAAAQYLLPPSNTAHLLNNGDSLHFRVVLLLVFPSSAVPEQFKSSLRAVLLRLRTILKDSASTEHFKSSFVASETHTQRQCNYRAL